MPHFMVRLDKNTCWVTNDNSHTGPWKGVTPSWDHLGSTHGEAVTARRAALAVGVREDTHRNFPLIFDPMRTVCSDSSLEMLPWNQGIFSWAVVAISFSSWGFWLMMACSRAWPCSERRESEPAGYREDRPVSQVLRSKSGPKSTLSLAHPSLVRCLK